MLRTRLLRNQRRSGLPFSRTDESAPRITSSPTISTRTRGRLSATAPIRSTTAPSRRASRAPSVHKVPTASTRSCLVPVLTRAPQEVVPSTASRRIAKTSALASWQNHRRNRFRLRPYLIEPSGITIRVWPRLFTSTMRRGPRFWGLKENQTIAHIATRQTTLRAKKSPKMASQFHKSVIAAAQCLGQDPRLSGSRPRSVS
jgi:hypothetical protein